MLGRRMVDDGVLRHRAEGRRAWYTLAEPLFRHWLEYRITSWEDTRVGWLGRLLEALMGPAEIADLWWKGSDKDIGAAARSVFERDTKASTEAWSVLFRNGVKAIVDEDLAAVRKALERIPELGTASPLVDILVAMSISLADPPLLKPEDVIHEVGEGSTDLEYLLAAAMAMGQSKLFAQAASHLGSQRFFQIVACPRPALPAPAALGSLGEYLVAALELSWAPVLSGKVITWAASFSQFSDTTWRKLLAGLKSANPKPSSKTQATETALTALALKNTQRFRELAAILNDAWNPGLERAALLALDLAESEQGQLHGELEILRKAMQEDPTSPA